jgi:hypothetical protein
VKSHELIDRLSHLAREASGDALTQAEHAGLQSLERTLARRKDRRRSARVAGWLAFAAALGATVAVFFLHDRALTFQVNQGRVSEGGYIVAESANATVRFSDQSELGMELGTRLRVSRLEVRGAHMMLEGGLLHVRIRPRPQATWSIDAGPYIVHVTGTEFDLAWDVAEQTLDLRLHEGKITLEGPLGNGALYMQAGQHLVANARDGSLSIVNEHDVESPSPSPADANAQVHGDPSGPSAVLGLPPSAAPRSGSSAGTVHQTAAPDGPTWASRVARGDFQGILEEAERHGVDRTLTDAPLGDLAALADAARYARRQDVARRALMAERTRFPGSVQARDAAFFLGGLAETAGDDAGALSWNETYLDESPSGALASQALGRKMMIVRRLRGPDEARVVAAEYLRRFHDGPYAPYARKLQPSP